MAGARSEVGSTITDCCREFCCRCEGTLFYLDPPYFGCERDYGEGVFARSDFTRIASRLGRLKGRFVLSLNDTPEVREIFGAFRRKRYE